MEDLKMEEKLLLIEGSLTAFSLAEGLDCLRKANVYEKGLYYQSFFSLSIGIERLLKLIIIYDYRVENDGSFPENKVIKEKGHNLYEMFNIVAPNILENDLFNSVIHFLSDFAKTTRYYNLDVLTGREIQKLNPLEEWKNIENMILKEYNVKIKTISNRNELINNFNQVADILFLDMNSNLVSNAEYIVNEIEERDTIQGHNVLVFYKIIRLLTSILTDYEIRNNLFPCLREYFGYFIGNLSDREIRTKKNWRKIVAGY